MTISAPSHSSPAGSSRFINETQGSSMRLKVRQRTEPFEPRRELRTAHQPILAPVDRTVQVHHTKPDEERNQAAPQHAIGYESTSPNRSW